VPPGDIRELSTTGTVSALLTNANFDAIAIDASLTKYPASFALGTGVQTMLSVTWAPVNVGATVGMAVGVAVGDAVGAVGAVGGDVGAAVGAVGFAVGPAVGAPVGCAVGAKDAYEKDVESTAKLAVPPVPNSVTLMLLSAAGLPLISALKASKSCTEGRVATLGSHVYAITTAGGGPSMDVTSYTTFQLAAQSTLGYRAPSTAQKYVSDASENLSMSCGAMSAAPDHVVSNLNCAPTNDGADDGLGACEGASVGLEVGVPGCALAMSLPPAARVATSSANRGPAAA
jgi:hypothetical protein